MKKLQFQLLCRLSEQGNVQIYHDGEWGSICDDEWDLYEANIACQTLGFNLGAKRPTHSSQVRLLLFTTVMTLMYWVVPMEAKFTLKFPWPYAVPTLTY